MVQIGAFLATNAGLAHVEMEVVFMRSVVFWPEHRAEDFAGIITDGSEKFSLNAFIIPVVQKCQR